MEASTSLFDRLVAQPRRPWITLGIVALLFAAPLLAAHAGNALSDLIRQGQWRGLFLSPAIITYILLIAPRMAGMESAVLRSLRAALAFPGRGWAWKWSSPLR
jgi:hypothetical protein